MELLDLLPPGHIVVPLEAASLRDAIHVLVSRLREQGALDAHEGLDRRIASEPLRDVVAVAERVVLPHFRSEAARQLVLALGLAPEPLAATELGPETRPRVVALILAPPDPASLYLQTLATLARLLRDRAFVDRLLACESEQEVRALPALQKLRIQPRLTVRDVMTHRVDTVSPDTTVHDVVDLMVRRRLRAVPVVNELGEVLGLVTDREIMRLLLPQLPRAGEDEDQEETSDAGRRPVREIMSRSVLCISEDLGISEAANMMINKDLDPVPIVSEGKLTGVVTRGDIIRKLYVR